jgi:O-antigen ligase
MSFYSMSKSRNNQKIFLAFLQIGILTTGLSVSISQMFLGLSFLLFLFDSERRARIRFYPIVLSTFLLFGMYLLSILWNYKEFPLDSSLLLQIKQSEFKDFLLFLAFFLTSTLKGEEVEKIKKTFFYLLILISITGFLSIFSIYRFSYLVNSLFRNVTTWNFQHHYGNIGGLDIYLPIGLMNTHLTFGGLLLFFTPFLIFKFFEEFKEKKSLGLKIIEFFLISCFFITVLLNNARSSILGSGVGVLFGIGILLFIQKKISLQKIWKLILIPFVLLSLVVISFSFSPTLRKTILPLLGSQKHTDSGRTFIWDSTFTILEKNPILGIGPGRYAMVIDASRKDRSEKNPKLLFFYEVTQRGHAHNDYFHIAAISGILNVFSYLGILYFILLRIQKRAKEGEDPSLFYGLIGFFFAGLFQCYFQDDEVVLVFWYLVGFLFSPTAQEEKK